MRRRLLLPMCAVSVRHADEFGSACTVCGVIRCSLCQITLTSCSSILSDSLFGISVKSAMLNKCSIADDGNCCVTSDEQFLYKVVIIIMRTFVQRKNRKPSGTWTNNALASVCNDWASLQMRLFHILAPATTKYARRRWIFTVCIRQTRQQAS